MIAGVQFSASRSSPNWPLTIKSWSTTRILFIFYLQLPVLPMGYQIFHSPFWHNKILNVSKHEAEGLTEEPDQNIARVQNCIDITFLTLFLVRTRQGQGSQRVVREFIVVTVVRVVSSGWSRWSGCSRWSIGMIWKCPVLLFLPKVRAAKNTTQKL